VSVVGIMKTIEHDIPIIDKSFGFETTVEVNFLIKQNMEKIRKQQELSNPLLLKRLGSKMELDW